MKRKLLLFYFILLLLLKPAFAQKEYNMWYFDDRAGLNFNTNPPSPLTDGQIRASEGASGICDSNGNILFYTDGDTVWNRYHQLMKNGASAEYDHANSVQSAIVMKNPGSDHLYYIFCPAPNTYDRFLRYWVIDMNGDNGKGEATVVNKILLPDPLENVSVTKHSNEKDFWVCCVDHVLSGFKCVRTKNEEIDTTIIRSNLYNANSYNAKFSPNGKMLYGNIGTTPNGSVIRLYQFDNSKGLLTSKLEIAMPGSAWGGAEFSHDSRFLYVCHSETPAFDNRKNIVQYDLAHWNKDSIEQSATIVHRETQDFHFTSGMQLGPDHKIYLFRANNDSLYTIDHPYLKGMACHVTVNAVSLAGREHGVGAPYYPNYWFAGLYVDLDSVVTICEGDSLVLDTRVSPFAHVRWNTGDTTTSIVVKQEGVYTVTVFNQTDTVMDFTRVRMGKKFQVYLGSDTAFCGAFSHLLDAGKNAMSYHWNTGDTTVSIMVDQPGIYAVAVKDSNSCPAGDTIQIDQLLRPFISINYDSINCDYVYLDASPRQNGAQYQWSTGDTSLMIQVDKKGKYDLVIKNLFCSVNQSIMVDKLPLPDINLGEDISLCEKPLIVLSANDGDRFLWSTGLQTQSIDVTTAGTYWVTAWRTQCVVSDTIHVGPGCDMTYFIPTAFTPQQDGINETFKVRGAHIDQANIQIYNRWGGKIYEGSEWDGTCNGKSCLPDTYVYLITIRGNQKGRSVEKQVSGNITLLR